MIGWIEGLKIEQLGRLQVVAERVERGPVAVVEITYDVWIRRGICCAAGPCGGAYEPSVLNILSNQSTSAENGRTIVVPFSVYSIVPETSILMGPLGKAAPIVTLSTNPVMPSELLTPSVLYILTPLFRSNRQPIAR